MTESRIKSLWKQQWPHSKNNLLNCTKTHSSSSSSSMHTSPSMIESINSDSSSSSSSRLIDSPKKQQLLWRKPLPPDCPKFEFIDDDGSTNGEKTLIQIDAQVNSIIPLRRDSRFYKQIPYFDALLERTCKSKRVAALSIILQNK